MKVKVGYITSWRRTLFFTVILCIIVFGMASTVSLSMLGAGLISRIISVGALVLDFGLFFCVLRGGRERYTGFGTAVVTEDGIFTYSDKKRRYKIRLSDITKLDMEKITSGKETLSLVQGASAWQGIEHAAGERADKPIGYRLLIQTGRKKNYIESEWANEKAYHEVDLYRLYLFLQEKKTAEVNKQGNN